MELAKKLLISGGALFFFGVTFCGIAFPPFLKFAVKAKVSLKKGSDVRELWSDFPVPLEFSIYLFNITNPEGIQKGEKPKVQEIGPFYYDEWRQKVNLKDREEDDTVEYNGKQTWIFNPSKSHGLTGKEELVFPHLILLGIIMTIMREQPAMIDLAVQAMNSIFKNPESTFIRATAYDILFGGLPIDCRTDDFAGSTVCALLRDSGGLQADGEDRYRFSLLGQFNGTANKNRVRVRRGIKKSREVGQVIEYNGKTKLSNWEEGSICNEFNGTDATIFHPYLFEDEDIVTFSTDMCRSVSLHWDGSHTSVGGLPANHYTADLGDTSTDPELKCFCPSEDNCMKKGLHDLFPCINVPIVASLPHFYKVDEMYLNQVDGLHPQKEKHQIDLDFQPLLGIPMSARTRMQLNMFVYPIEDVEIMKTFPTALLPLLWIEEAITLGDLFLDQLRLVFKLKAFVKIMKWIMIIVGLGLGGAGAGLEYKKRQMENKLRALKIMPKWDGHNKLGQEKMWPMNVNALEPAVFRPHLIPVDVSSKVSRAY